MWTKLGVQLFDIAVYSTVVDYYFYNVGKHCLGLAQTGMLWYTQKLAACYVGTTPAKNSTFSYSSLLTIKPDCPGHLISESYVEAVYSTP